MELKTVGRMAMAILVGLPWLSVSLSHAQQADSQGWPQLGRNPQRWNYSPEEIATPPYRVKWAFTPTDVDVAQRIHFSAQVVLGEGKAYIGTKAGTLFAIDIAVGKEAWRSDTGGPVSHTAAYGAGRVFVASMDGCVYAFDARTGKQTWKFSNQRRYGFSTAILLAEDEVFAVDRGGRLFALDQANGNEQWHYDAGAPVLNSPAYNDGRVYFGSEDMRVHAVDAPTGERLWRSEQLPGQSFLAYWPVVAGGRVIIRSMGGCEPMTTDEPITRDTAGANPRLKVVRTMFVLHEKTGQEAIDLPHFSIGVMNGPHSPPAITNDGLLVVSWNVYDKHEWYGNGWVLQDPKTGRIIERLWHAKKSEGDVQPLVGAPDETLIPSVFGDTVLLIHSLGFAWGNPNTQSGAYDRKTKTFYVGRRNWPTAPPIGAHETTNLQPGVNAFSGAGGLLFHQSHDVVTCYEPKSRTEQ